MKLRRHTVSMVVLLLACARPSYAAVSGVDALASAPPVRSRALALSRDPSTGARIAHVEERLGVPTFVWAAPRFTQTTPLAPIDSGRHAESEARRVVSEHASLWGLSDGDLDTMVLTHVHDTGRGPLIATFRSVVDGVEVFRDELHVGMARDLSPIALSGYLAPVSSLARAGGFRLDRREAVAIAFHDVTGASLDPGELVSEERRGAYERLAWRPVDASGRFASRIRVKQVWFHLPGQLVPAWYLDMRVGKGSSTDVDYVAWVVSAVDGSVLFRKDLTAADSFTYRVWADTTGVKMPFPSPAGLGAAPHATGVPDGWQATLVPPVLVSLQNGPIATNDPWLAAGATQTKGNNTDAYADLLPPDGFSSGDLRATVTAPGVFDRTLDTAGSPTADDGQRMAVVTQLFYDINFFHDWYYASGFTEAAGNAQQGNFGRGGAQGDSLLAEAQDSSGRNNANMGTPPDGESPVMQMYLWDGNGAYSMTVNAPASLAGVRSSTLAGFGPQSFQLTKDAVLIENTGGLHNGCTAPTNASALSGKIAMIERGSCDFDVKVKLAQTAGAVGVLMLNNQAGLISMGGDDTTITIPAMMVKQTDGTALKAATGVNLTFRRDAVPDRDGGVDNQIVGHEWGHYISNRLVGDAMGIATNMSGGLGEGWADFHALLLTVKESDRILTPGFTGAYSAGGYVMGGYGDQALPNDGYYFGVRRVPYSTLFTIDPLTFKHISEGVALPTTAPLAYGASGVGNSEVHSAGEIWCSMLWESYAALLNDTARFTFTQAQERMKDILVAAYKLTPNNPTLLEARDAILAAALTFDQEDYILIAKAFARRGAGTRAVAPDRYEPNNAGVVESYLASGDVALVSAALDDGLVSCDVDGILDTGETGLVTLVLKNVGTGPLSGTSLTLAPATTGASVVGPAVVAVPEMQPFQTATVKVPVSLAQVSGILSLGLSATVNDPTFAQALVLPLAFRANADDVAAQSATDDVESAHPVSSLTGTWKRVEIGALDHRWRGEDPGVPSESRLVTPSFDVTGAFKVTFRHRYRFPIYQDSSGTYYLDGAVVEASTNGGTSWADVSTLGATIAYNGTIYPYWNNPLNNRRAFGGTISGWPALKTVTLDFGTGLTGKSVRLRFRIGTTWWEGASGWDIDDIVVTGTTSNPFGAVVAHRAQCVTATTITLGATPTSSVFGGNVTLTATVAGATSGTVTFLDGGVAIGTGTVGATGTATYSTTSLAVGTHSLTAFRAGTTSSAPATSGTVTVTVTRGSGATTSSAFIPIVLDLGGNAHYVSEMTLTNPGTLPVTATLVYTASFGSGSGTAHLVLGAGEQHIFPDALTALRIQGLSIPWSTAGNQGGTLAISFDNVTPGAPPAATVRTFALTAAPQPVGYAGLAYGGLAPAEFLTSNATIYGLRASGSDRSHVAVFNTGSVPVTVKVTVFSGAGNGTSVVVESGKTLAAGDWTQYSYILDNASYGTTGITKGWAVVERTSADGSFGTYGVINDNTTNDGSYIQPVTGSISGSGITVPVLVETPVYRSELVLANRGTASASLVLNYVESNTPASGAGGAVNVTLAAGEEQIIPEATEWLRTNGVSIGAKDAASYVGALRVAVSGVDTSSVFAGARTASQSPAGGQFGLFTPGVYSGNEASTSAALYGLRVGANDRSNVAVVNAGDDSAGSVTLSLQAYDGAAGGVAKGIPTTVTLAPGAWKQYDSLVKDAGVANGWVVVSRTSGTAPWLAYAVINDGGKPGNRTGDGAYVPMTR